MAAERRVLLTADTVGGVWTYAIELARGLAHRGWAVHLATMGAPVSRRQQDQAHAVPGLTLHDGGHKLEWMQSPWAEVDAAGEWLLKLEREIAPDVVHLNQFAFGALPFRAPTLLVAHSCVLSWWQAVRGTPLPAEWAEYRRRVAQGLHGARLVAAPTRAMLRTLAANYGIGPRSIVLPNGRDPALFRPAAKRNVVLAAGRFWDEAKNLSALDAVAQALPWPVLAAGACTSPDGGQRVPRHVCALGELSTHELSAEMGSAAIFAHPARYEPFGLSVLEAAMSGCALVLGEIASLHEIWGDAALYVAPDDHDDLRDVLARLMHDRPRRIVLGQAALARALQLTADAMVRCVTAAYDQLLQPQTHTPPEELICA